MTSHKQPRVVELRRLLSSVDVLETAGALPDRVTGITQDSRLVEPGFVFAARSGNNVSGLDFITQARQNGATLLLAAEPLPPGLPLPALRVGNFRRALAVLSGAIYRDPSRRLKLIGVTGTNGKTTSTYLIRSIIESGGRRCGLLGTVEYDTVRQRFEAGLTTPDIDRLCALLAEMADAGCSHAVMEVSSHALAQGRAEGLSFAAAAFTNLTSEHLDYHGTIEEYAQAKARLFKMMEPDGVAVVNSDNPWGKVMAEAARGEVMTFSTADRETPPYSPPTGVRGEGSEADITVTGLEHSLGGGRFRMDVRGRAAAGGMLETGAVSFEVFTPLVGVYHGENIALAAGVALGLGIEVGDIVRGVAEVKSIPGRMEPVDAGQPFTVLADYSHTPDSLARALQSLRPLCQGRLIVVFGCGGNRDRSKRPVMGRIVAELADLVVITSDNPRWEVPAAIAGEISAALEGGQGVEPVAGSVMVEIDRRAAIRQALSIARAGDVVLIAGKGHETYQEIKGVRRPFDDRLVAAEEINRLGCSV